MHAVFAGIGSPPDPAFGVKEIRQDGQAQLRAAIAQRVQHAVDVDVDGQPKRMGRHRTDAAPDSSDAQRACGVDPGIKVGVNALDCLKYPGQRFQRRFQHGHFDRPDLPCGQQRLEPGVFHRIAIVRQCFAGAAQGVDQETWGWHGQPKVQVAPVCHQNHLVIGIQDRIGAKRCGARDRSVSG